MKSIITTETDILVPFHDVDAMHVVWHGHYYKYFEIARTQLLQTIDYDVIKMKESGFSWPVIETSCKYIRPILYDQTIRVFANLQEYENRLKVSYRIVDSTTNEKLAKGYTIQVGIDMIKNEMCFVSPKILWEKIKLLKI